MTYNSVQSFEYDTVQKHYDEDSQRLFLVYYPVIPGYNRNRWGVSESSIDANIKTAVNKPVVIYRKNPNNKFHAHQAGLFVHPTPEEAAAELGHFPNAEEYYNWQEKFAIGRVRAVEKRDKGYAFTLEITDQDSKQVLKSADYQNSAPGFTSPQILSNAGLYPAEERSGIYDHWGISHIALVDVPAYGYEQAGIRAKCLGTEQTCKITTRSASNENLGFCVRQATIDLIESHSSHVDSLSTSSHHKMSTSENTSQPTKATSETLTYNPTTTDNAPQQPSPNVEPAKEQPAQSLAPSTKEEEQKEQQELQSVKTLDEANVQIKQMSELLKEQTKQLKAQQKELDLIKQERKQARLSYLIPRELFKSDESHQKEVQKFMNENISEQWLAEYWKTKKELAMAQSTAKRMELEPIAAKSASLQNNGHDVPDFSSSQNQNVRTNIQKTLDLQKRILEGGTY